VEPKKDAIYSFRTTNIKGRAYVQVNERLRFFKERYPNWTIFTEILDRTQEEILMRAIIKDENDKFRAEGLAHEMKSTSMINKTSYVENCQTSAIGRALGFLGIGITDSIATAEEVSIAMEAQDALSKEDKRLKNEISELLKKIADQEFVAKASKFIEGTDSINLLKSALVKVQEQYQKENL
jgi:hypothetical protein